MLFHVVPFYGKIHHPAVVVYCWRKKCWSELKWNSSHKRTHTLVFRLATPLHIVTDTASIWQAEKSWNVRKLKASVKILGEEGVIEERTKREKTAERYCNRGLRGKTERKRDNQGFRLEQLKQCFLSLYFNSLFGPTIPIKRQKTWARKSKNLEKPPFLSQTNRYSSVKTHFLWNFVISLLSIRSSSPCLSIFF